MVSQPAPEPDATQAPDRKDLARSAASWSLGGLVNGVLVVGGAIGGAVGASMLVGRNGDPLETLAGVFLVAPVAGGYFGHLLFLSPLGAWRMTA